MREYKIEELETEMPEIFPGKYWVLVQAIEKSTNLIRLFTSKNKTIDNNLDYAKQELKKEIFADKYALNIALRPDYEIIEYNENLKFTKDKRGRYYSRYLVNFNGKRVRDI